MAKTTDFAKKTTPASGKAQSSAWQTGTCCLLHVKYMTWQHATRKRRVKKKLANETALHQSLLRRKCASQPRRQTDGRDGLFELAPSGGRMRSHHRSTNADAGLQRCSGAEQESDMGSQEKQPRPRSRAMR